MALPYHEPTSELSPMARDLHRALTSTMEELEAIDWYNQRADVTQDESLKAVLLHNRDEEIEHAAMTLEWLRRRMPEFDEALKIYLFTTRPITEIEEEAASGEGGSEKADQPSGSGALGIGKFKKGS